MRYVKLFPIVLKLLPLQGALFATHKSPGRCPGLGASAPSGRAAYIGFLPSGRAAYIGFLPSGRAAYIGFLPLGRVAYIGFLPLGRAAYIGFLPLGRVAYIGFLAFWVCCLYEFLGLPGVLLI